MKFTNDPIYRALNQEMPDKEKVLAQALAAMEEMPKVKRAPRRRLVLAWGSAVAVLLMIMIPVIILSQQGVISGAKRSAPGDSEDSYSAPAAPDDADNAAIDIYFDLTRDNDSRSEPELQGAEGPIASYKVNFLSVEESVMIYLTTQAPPPSTTDTYLENLNVNGKYTVETEAGVTIINLYFTYQSRSYLVVIRCADASRMEYYLEHIRAA